jgi:hypothetical protein
MRRRAAGLQQREAHGLGPGRAPGQGWAARGGSGAQGGSGRAARGGSGGRPACAGRRSIQRVRAASRACGPAAYERQAGGRGSCTNGTGERAAGRPDRAAGGWASWRCCGRRLGAQGARRVEARRGREKGGSRPRLRAARCAAGAGEGDQTVWARWRAAAQASGLGSRGEGPGARRRGRRAARRLWVAGGTPCQCAGLGAPGCCGERHARRPAGIEVGGLAAGKDQGWHQRGKTGSGWARAARGGGGPCKGGGPAACSRPHQTSTPWWRGRRDRAVWRAGGGWGEGARGRARCLAAGTWHGVNRMHPPKSGEGQDNARA